MKKALGAAVLAVAGLFAFTGCGEKSGNTVKIGAIGPLSGAVAVYGVDCLNGINLAAEEINAGDEVSVDFDTGVITDITTGREYKAQPFPEFIQNIIAKGGLLASLKED